MKKCGYVLLIVSVLICCGRNDIRRGIENTLNKRETHWVVRYDTQLKKGMSLDDVISLLGPPLGDPSDKKMIENDQGIFPKHLIFSPYGGWPVIGKWLHYKRHCRDYAVFFRGGKYDGWHTPP